jgi:hypothetical protein
LENSRGGERAARGLGWGEFHLGTGKEVLYTILKATWGFSSSKECNKNFNIFSNSQSATILKEVKYQINR